MATVASAVVADDMAGEVDEDTAAGPVDAEASPPAVPSRWRFGWVVGGAVLAGLAVRVAIGLTDGAPPTDETAFLKSGLSIVHGHGFVRNGHPETHFPPLVPFLIGLASKLFTDPHRGAVAVTCVASTLVILPLALTARTAAGPRAGMVTAWVAALGPGLSTTFVTAGNGSEAVYTLVVLTAVWCVVAAASYQGWARHAWVAAAGLCIGLAYLTRPEGLFLALPLVIGVVVLGWSAGSGLLDWRRLVGPAAFMVPLLVCLVPYAMFLHHNTGKWELSAKTQDVSIAAWRGVADGDRRARDEELYKLDASGFHLPTARTSLPALARKDPGGYVGIVGANVRMLGRTVISSDDSGVAVWPLLPAPLWVLAGLGAWRLRRSRTVQLLLAVTAIPVATALAFFVLTRYLVLIVGPAAVLIGVAVTTLSERRRRWVLAGTFALLALSTVFAFKGRSGWWHPGDHTAQRAAGEWIAANTGPTDRIMTRSMVVEYYGDRTTIALPYANYPQMLAYGRHYGVQYLVLDPSTYYRLRPQLRFLSQVDTWPGVRLIRLIHGEEGTVRIFALDPAPPPSAPTGPSLGFVGDS